MTQLCVFVYYQQKILMYKVNSWNTTHESVNDLCNVTRTVSSADIIAFNNSIFTPWNGFNSLNVKSQKNCIWFMHFSSLDIAPHCQITSISHVTLLFVSAARQEDCHCYGHFRHSCVSFWLLWKSSQKWTYGTRRQHVGDPQSVIYV